MSGTRVNTIAVSVGLVLLLLGLAAPSANAKFHIVRFEGGVFNQDGTSATQAASHPYSASATLEFTATDFNVSDGSMKDVTVELPPGLVGNPSITPIRCTIDQLTIGGGNLGRCPVGSQVGIATLLQGGSPGVSVPTSTVPIYNMERPRGYPALFGFRVLGAAAFVSPKIRSGSDYGITLRSPETTQVGSVTGAIITLWGVPADPSHDGDRGTTVDAGLADSATLTCATSEATPECTNPAGYAPKAFITNPANCSAGPLTTTLRVNSWAESGVFHTARFDHDSNGNPAAVGDCETVPFQPDISLRPKSNEADSPTGLDVELTMPTRGIESPTGLGQAPLKRAVVTLPEGMSVNPSSAAGLGACTAQQIGLTQDGATPQFTPDPAQCPESSKVGTVTVATPLLDQPLEGSVYLGAQDDPLKAGDENPFGSLLSLYLAVNDLQTGIVLKLPGRVDPDPTTGRLVASFDDNPQLPFSSLQLNFKSGPRAPLIAPPTCGSYDILSELSPWSAANPDHPTAVETVTKRSTFHITSGPNRTSCPSSDQIHPSFEAGTQTPLAGLFSPLVVNASRPDGSQPLTGINLALPPGLTGKLAGIPYCSDSGIAQAQGRNQLGDGAVEQSSPSCSSASQVGSVDVAAGAGPNPFHVQGKAYLAGPYKGAPLSLVVITSAVAGPFDLGVVAVRAALQVNPITAQISAESDPIPQILHGIPLKIRSISVNADKPDFTLNPTNCEPFALTGTLFGSSASAPVSSHFQVGACKGLDFEPKLALRVFGKTNRNAKPRFRAVLQASPGEANLARAQVTLPHSLFLEQSHIKTVCTRVQWNQGAGHGSACPPGSSYGRAQAWTPLLAEPLQGPVYLRSSSHKLPDLVAALNGQVDIELAGKVDSGKNQGLRNTFELVPDAPVSKFILEMKGKRKGLLVNSENLCSKKAKTRAIVRFIGQNGAVHAFKPKVAAACGKKAKKKHRTHGKQPKAGSRR